MDEMGIFSQVEEHLKCGEQNWLLGAGISFDAKIPLMYPLTRKVKLELTREFSEINQKIILPLVEELPESCHVEHILSHLGDYAALADRNKNKKTTLAGKEISISELNEAHQVIIEIISKVIRYGYVENSEEGTSDNPIVEIDAHFNFIDNLFNHLSAGISDRRKAINLFTTNYDTLLEDALSLNRISYWDGFSGGAIAYRVLRYGESVPDVGQRANLIKLHGSIDWVLDDKANVLRVREKDRYPKSGKEVLIYPQSTKYIATQQDPFSVQFDLFRKSLNSKNSNLLSVCGYSFGDDHINNEIFYSLSKEENKTVLLVFLECKDHIPQCIEDWRRSSFGGRVFIASRNGLYVGSEGPFKRMDDDDWWTFKGMTRTLKDGCEV